MILVFFKSNIYEFQKMGMEMPGDDPVPTISGSLHGGLNMPSENTG